MDQMTRGDEALFEVCEVFRSLQGETSRTGLPATFLRLAGCNLRCRYCDTTYAQGRGASMTLEELLGAVADGPATDLVVVTGGEPLLQPRVPSLLGALCDLGRTVLLETNGSLEIRGIDPRVRRILDIKCPGSGEEASTRWENLEDLRAEDEVKLVLTCREDFDFALRVIMKHGLRERCEVLLSPAQGLLAPADLAAWILECRLPLRLQLQLHRILWPGRDRGV